MLSKEDLESWNNFKKKCKKTKGVDLFNLSIKGKTLLNDIKKSLKDKKNEGFEGDFAPITNDFLLKKNNTLGIDWKSDKKLSQGKYKIDYKVDLHGMTLNEAYNQLKLVFNKAEINNYRCLLIITGKGLHSQNQTIKNSISEWFKESYFSNKIIKYIDAQKMHGGSGAIYVLLKR